MSNKLKVNKCQRCKGTSATGHKYPCVEKKNPYVLENAEKYEIKFPKLKVSKCKNKPVKNCKKKDCPFCAPTPKKKGKTKAEYVKIRDFKEKVIGIVTYKEGFVVATETAIWTNVKDLISKIANFNEKGN